MPEVGIVKETDTKKVKLYHRLVFGIEAYKSIRILPRGFLQNQKVFIYNTKF